MGLVRAVEVAAAGVVRGIVTTHFARQLQVGAISLEWDDKGAALRNARFQRRANYRCGLTQYGCDVDQPRATEGSKSTGVEMLMVCL